MHAARPVRTAVGWRRSGRLRPLTLLRGLQIFLSYLILASLIVRIPVNWTQFLSGLFKLQSVGGSAMEARLPLSAAPLLASPSGTGTVAPLPPLPTLCHAFSALRGPSTACPLPMPNQTTADSGRLRLMPADG